MKLIIDIPEYIDLRNYDIPYDILNIITNGTPLTPDTLADLLMEERIRGKLNSDTTFEKDIIRDVKCILSVNIRDRRPCYCGATLREAWRKSEVTDADNN